MEYIKMHTCGNSYIYVDCFKNNVDIKNTLKEIKNLCDYNYGIGSQGIVFITPSDKAAAKIYVYNRDGSEAKISGNALFGTSKFLYDNKMVKDNFEIETKAGNRKIDLIIKNNEIKKILINIGKPIFNSKQIPVITEKDFFINEEVNIKNKKFKLTSLSLGNPHTVILTDKINEIDLETLGPYIETSYLFPEKTNVEFVELRDKNNIKVRYWERGSGETLFCVTGACAAVASLVTTNYLEKNTNIHVYSKGGKVVTNYNNDILMLGNVEEICRGKVLIKK